jgi:hypothetical protein
MGVANFAVRNPGLKVARSRVAHLRARMDGALTRAG